MNVRSTLSVVVIWIGAIAVVIIGITSHVFITLSIAHSLLGAIFLIFVFKVSALFIAFSPIILMSELVRENMTAIAARLNKDANLK